MSLSRGREGFALKISIAHGGIWSFPGKDAIFSGGRRHSHYRSTAAIPSPSPAARACPILSLCNRSQVHLCLNSASSLRPPLRHPFTTNFDVLLPPRGSRAGHSLRSPPRDSHRAANAHWLKRCLFRVYREIYTHTYICMYIGATWADERLQEEGTCLDEAASSSVGPPVMVLLPLAPGWTPPRQRGHQRAPARRWDGALFPEIAFKVVFKKKPP